MLASTKDFFSYQCSMGQLLTRRRIAPSRRSSRFDTSNAFLTIAGSLLLRRARGAFLPGDSSCFRCPIATHVPALDSKAYVISAIPWSLSKGEALQLQGRMFSAKSTWPFLRTCYKAASQAMSLIFFVKRVSTPSCTNFAVRPKDYLCMQ